MKMDGDDDNGGAFCTGAGVAMYMDGFTSSLRHRWWRFGSTTQRRHTIPPCLNLFFTAWRLDTEAKFIAACIGVVALAMSVELLGAYRRIRAAQHAAACRKQERLIAGWLHRLETALVYGAQLAVGYFVMLAVMSYSSELFACTMFGIVSGHLCLRRVGLSDLGRLTCLSKEQKSPQLCCSSNDCNIETGSDYSLIVDDDASGTVSRAAPFPVSLGFSIPGMTCDACVATIHNVLLACDGVCAVQVDLPNKRAFVYGSCNLRTLCAALDTSGYTPAAFDQQDQGVSRQSDVSVV